MVGNMPDTGLSLLGQLRRQAGAPQGLIGRLLGYIMTWHNHRDCAWTIQCLAVKPGDQVLEVGFGPGHGIKMLARQDTEINVTGIDHSRDMLQMAARRNHRAVRDGRVQLGLGSVMQLPFADNTFDKAMSINCIYFWDDPVHGLRELYHVLRRGGCLAVTVRDRNRPAYTRFNAEELERMFKQAGFSQISVKRNEGIRKPALCVTGYK
ncbi:MAG: methyltransferase domain-containing protein [Gammaproteobacteria bacterium]